MYMKLFCEILILSIIINEALSECICTENKGQARCVHINLSDVQVRNNQQDATALLTIDPTSSQNLPFNNIKTLQLQCNIQTLQPDWFANQGSLTDLDLQGNSIVRIPNNFFVPISNLERLILSHNKLRNPTPNTFHALHKLKVLDISYNKISNIEVQILDEMTKLEKLYVNNNGIFNIDVDIFEMLNNLIVLDLSYNYVTEISPGLFKNNGKLKEVNLARNNFDGVLPIDMFDDLKKITVLNLSECKIRLQPGVFNKTTKLVTLDVSKNSLQSLPKDIFDHLKDLRNLNLARCNLRNLPEGLFKGNPNLEELNLSNNNLRNLPNGTFSTAHNFKYLNFSKNLVREVPAQLFQHTILTDIDLSSNLLTHISPELLNIRTLQNVHLQNNKIVHLNEVTVASGTFPVKFLDLRNNKLVFLKDAFFTAMANLEKLEILGNPWDCSCFHDLSVILDEKNIHYTSGDYYEGKLPVCVVSDLDTCNVDEKNLTYYYTVYNNNL